MWSVIGRLAQVQFGPHFFSAQHLQLVPHLQSLQQPQSFLTAALTQVQLGPHFLPVLAHWQLAPHLQSLLQPQALLFLQQGQQSQQQSAQSQLHSQVQLQQFWLVILWLCTR